MNFKYTVNTLKKMEQLFEETGFRVRYEKGHFNSGYCILEAKNIVVVNKFLDVEGKINVLLELLPELHFKKENLSEDMLKLYHQINDNNANLSSIVQTQMKL